MPESENLIFMQKPQEQTIYNDSTFFSILQKIINIFHYFIVQKAVYLVRIKSPGNFQSTNV